MQRVVKSYKYLRKIERNNEQFHRHCSSVLKEAPSENCNVENVQDVYQRWLENPSSVSSAWDTFFRTVAQTNQHINNQEPNENDIVYGSSTYRHHYKGGGPGAASSDAQAVDEAVAVAEMIRTYQTRGYHLAQLDPLGVAQSTERGAYLLSEDIPYKHVKDELRRVVKEITAEINNDRVFKLPPNTYIGGNSHSLPLKDIIKRMEDCYCGSFGIEFGHLNSSSQQNWLKQKFEVPGATKISKDVRRLTLARLIRTSGYEAFVAKKYPGVKRFGAEGSEMLIPCMKQIVDKSTELGTEIIGIAMAHRGRVNVMANVCKKPLPQVIAQFQPLAVDAPFEADVKYHLGLSVTRLNKVTNKTINMFMLSNPSHLECSAPILQGRVHAEQFYRKDKSGRKILPIVVHGDAAMAGQGVVYETVQMGDLPHFTTHGTVHIALNNQLGFTTLPLHGRSAPFCTEIAKVTNSPVIHVNGYDPEAVVYAANVAAEWRAIFHKDIFLDILLFRRSGHNEGDEPMFTQPVMYTKIHQTKSILEIYAEKLVNEGLVNAKEIEDVRSRYEKLCEEALEEAKKMTTFSAMEWVDSPWPDFNKENKRELTPTGVAEDILQHVAKAHSTPPPTGFAMFKGLERIFKGRMDLINAKMFDWSLAEACAFGTLLKEGTHVRLSGQDVERGTFSHRHYVLQHQTSAHEIYIQLNHLYPDQALFSPTNSFLAEYAVLGFELGYSQANPNALCIWEAQFGDFVNTAQCMVDCFVSCGEAKWHKQSGLVINLPHGLEGMGADHSSARPERFLVQVVDDINNIPTGSDAVFRQLRECNWIVAQVTTPANLFHIYRRQIHMPIRKPLINFFPKSLLRLPAARSPIADFKDGTSFQRVIPDPVSPAAVKKIVFSVGKVYYDFSRARKAKKLENEIALVRIEQVYPFPFDLVVTEAAKYPNAKICFGQEEHMNHGYHQFVIPRLQKVLPGKEIKLITRGPGHSNATGLSTTHVKQLTKLLEDFINA